MTDLVLADWLLGIAAVPADLATMPVTGARLDHREIQPGEAFVALAGGRVHGLDFADMALGAGAVVVLFDPGELAGHALPSNAVAVPALRSQLGMLAARLWPKAAELRVVGVTGTNGKTSNVQLLAEAFTLAGGCAGSIGTLGHGLHGRLQAGERTTPDVLSVHRSLAELRASGAELVAMEVSSHALDQGRVAGVAFDVAVFTNLTRDHLDYHGSMEAYGAAKARLFQCPGLRAAVVNIDDAFGRALMLPEGIVAWTVSASGDARARLRALEVGLGPAGLRFLLAEEDVRVAVRSPLLGRFNVDNLLTVAGALRALGIGLTDVARLLGQLAPVHGRMTRCGGDAGRPLVVVDYAHTPDALQQALESLREHTRARLHCVFGCGGERDRGKRAPMAAIAERLADVVTVTDDNPRGEDGDAIVAEILSGFARPALVRVQRDRRVAIAEAIAAADTDDVVLVAGKGHESYQEDSGVRQPFDDLTQARLALGVAA